MSNEMAVNRITRQIGAVRLQALTPLQIEGLYATLLEKGGSGGRALAPKTVRNCHIVLRRALADAERLGLVTRNPAAAAKPVTAPRAEQRTWSSEEIQRFFDAAAGERLSMAFVVLATTGMRRNRIGCLVHAVHGRLPRAHEPRSGTRGRSVHYTFVDAHQHDYFCRVVEDCVAGSSIEAHEASLRAMEYLQTGARRTSDEVVAAFEKAADPSMHRTSVTI